jgi:hypothetical protein
MPVPSYGAMPLSKMFLGVRVLQALCMVIAIGITSNFVQMIVTTGVEPPKEFVGTLSVVSSNTRSCELTTNHHQTCIATLYIMVSVGYYWSHANLGLLVMTGVDSLLLIAFIVCAVTLGKLMLSMRTLSLALPHRISTALALVGISVTGLVSLAPTASRPRPSGAWLLLSGKYSPAYLHGTIANTPQHLVHCLLCSSANPLVQEQEAFPQGRLRGVKAKPRTSFEHQGTLSQ